MERVLFAPLTELALILSRSTSALQVLSQASEVPASPGRVSTVGFRLKVTPADAARFQRLIDNECGLSVQLTHTLRQTFSTV
ncbi:hypothetical protein EDF68_12220 [Ochrobactrum sp. BH3]|nr:hypothetical protein EDF68_12220 [Ochrobactrum sp. BH3]